MDPRQTLASLSHPGWLLAALLSVVFIQFALNRGGVDQAIWVVGLLLGLQIAAGAYRPSELPRRDLVVLGLFGAVLALSWLVAPADTDPHRSLRIARFLVLILAVRQLASQGIERQHAAWIAAVACAVVLWQMVSRLALGSPYGTFSNPHYLAYFSALLLPVLVLLARLAGRRLRPLLYFAALLALALVFNNLQNPTIPFLALVAASGAVLWSGASSRVRWTVAAVGLLLAAALLALPSHWLGMLQLTAPAEDERVRLWADAWRMIAEGDLRSWLFGHGIGSFRRELPGHTSTEFVGVTMPHNHVLGLLYENGALAAAVLTGFIGLLWIEAMRLTRGLCDASLRQLARANLAGLAIWLVFSFLAFDTYSRYTLYPFGFLLGIHLHLASAAARERSAAAGDSAATPSR